MCSSAESRLTSSAITLETGEFPAGKIKMILPGWLKKRPQQGAGKGINKHGSSRHSQALLGLAPRLEEAPEGLEGRSPTWGGWGEGGGLASRLWAQGLARRHQPALHLRGARAPRGSSGGDLTVTRMYLCPTTTGSVCLGWAHAWLPLPPPTMGAECPGLGVGWLPSPGILS